MNNKALIKVGDIVEVVTNPRQVEASMATVLEFVTVFNEKGAIIKYHNNSCDHVSVALQYMKKSNRLANP